jgi:hypothetical protein
VDVAARVSWSARFALRRPMAAISGRMSRSHVTLLARHSDRARVLAQLKVAGAPSLRDGRFGRVRGLSEP